jgi:septal ring factor EnvC (AmiA/AmiB activator)
MNNSGKTLTIFLVVIALLLVSVAGISVFFFLKEVDLREAAEAQLKQVEDLQAKVQGDLKEAQKKTFLLEEKKKEAEDKIESLMEELDLEKGLREQTKKENKDLRDTLDKETKAKEELEAQLRQELETAEEKLADLQQKLDSASAQNAEIEKRRQDLEAQLQQLKEQVGPLGQPDAGPASEKEQPPGPPKEGAVTDVQLEKIVVNPAGEGRGKIISIDTETNFVIVSLGAQDGINEGATLGLYRGDNYLGDVKVTRVLPEMAAADFILPLTSDNVQKDDRVVVKQ